ncbi:peptide/nickel transport system permease protein [Ruminiclostridium sufflavum DSM 19573]|uniref:Peptide/nickel transport system permease protein n=1 Tax=Ruminiclostridium sufflavum DSM 19573 TaxID=1121337 RepID=A0A318XPJ0_9FIRM|nr:ABC transporter permease [Ruminiclostridium sufflavum]PYG90266.1 peptide/nickel transport system permease protein [Ruminiclostridium sufflavum DSM 19573]
MLRYTIKRIIMMIPVLLGVTIILFFIQALTPGNPADVALGQDAAEADKAAWISEHGLDDPIVVQYGKYMYKIITKGDFGTSYTNGKPITGELISHWPTTIKLALMSLLMACIIGILLGILAAMKRNTWIDSIARVFSILGVSMPNFWFAMLLIMLFSLKLKWLPVSGSYGPMYWILPIATLGILNAAGIMRFTRAAMLDNSQQDFVRTARAKGQSERMVIWHHILGNAMIPITTCIGQYLIGALAGAIIIEQIFSLPGLGSLMMTAINQRDYPLLRGSVLLVAVSTSVIFLLIDLSYAAIDPRVKARFKSITKSGKLSKKQVQKN